MTRILDATNGKSREIVVGQITAGGLDRRCTFGRRNLKDHSPPFLIDDDGQRRGKDTDERWYEWWSSLK